MTETTIPRADDQEDLLKEIAQRYTGSSDVKIAKRYDNYFGGSLYQINITVDSHPLTIFVHKGKKVELFDNTNDVIVWTRSQKSQLFTNTDPLLLVPSFIAIMITTIIGWYAIEGKGEAPSYLANAMATILGFYFGRSTTR